MNAPSYAGIAVTYQCNSRCAMCDVWQKPPSRELDPEVYQALPKSLRNVDITGGEPFLREDLPAIVSAIRDRCPDARLVVSTNGFLTERIVAFAAEMPEIVLRISIDGCGELHDRIRGIDGAFEKSMETVRALKNMGHVDLGIALTASTLNEGELFQVKELADELEVEFTIAVAHSSPSYFGAKESLSPGPRAVPELERIRDSHLASGRAKEWFRAYFVDGLIDYVAGRPRPVKCLAARGGFFVDPEGGVHPCSILDERIGSLREGGPFVGDANVQRLVERCPWQCWMICTVAPAMRANPWPAARWVAVAKLGSAGRKQRMHVGVRDGG